MFVPLVYPLKGKYVVGVDKGRLFIEGVTPGSPHEKSRVTACACDLAELVELINDMGREEARYASAVSG